MITTDKIKTSYNFDVLWNIFEREPYQNINQKLLKLYKKWQKRQLTIGFTGHFSAGKSTLINALLEDDILPSSPIPTSANIVEIQYGNAESTTYHLPNNLQAKEETINLDHVKQLARNGETVESITIQKPINVLKNDINLMDTPGIDSSDDEEFKRTLSNTYLIDFFVYVMDYNHVQSEVNFKFLRELEDNRVPYVMVVNQVDKHNDEELQFDSFKQSLKESCRSWGLKPKHIFYTSLINEGHELNQFENLQQFLQQLIEDQERLIVDKLSFELENLMEEWANHKLDLNQNEYDSVNEKRNSIKRLFEEKKLIIEEKDQFRSKLNQKMNDLFQNAYIMTFETRESAKLYLESLQPKFKVGRIFSRKKTEEEKQRRQSEFLKAIQERVKTEMIWHIRRLLLDIMSEEQLEDQALTENIQNFSLKITEEDLNKSVNPSAEINANSVLIYTDQLHKDLSKKVKQEAASITTDLEGIMKQHQDRKIEKINENIKQIESELEDFQDLDALEEQKGQLVTQLKDQVFNEDTSNDKIELAAKEFFYTQSVDINELLRRDITEEETEHETKAVNKDERLNAEAIKKRSQVALSYIKDLSPLEPFNKSITEQFNQLENTQMTIALFGAFSAGKSSFANAWLGEAVLPASPNPTTAAINKIAPVSEKHEHGDVLVQYKTDDQLLNQLYKIIEPYTSETFNALSDLVKYLSKNIKTLLKHLHQTEASFIQAFLEGYQQKRTELGKERAITISEFPKYVTIESISCFIEEMTIFYDCDLTRKGITLVDTPGADSIHSRHTNTSLHYVKHSDAIIYVNYYNHAFSRADREFLIQLGRVKDTFALDKMFFILNAADLAKDQQELKLVENYLVDQLQQYGINQPSVYSLSSKALMDGEEKVDDQPFFHRFDQFIEQDAKEIMANQLDLELKRLNEYLSSTIKEAESNKEEQEQKLIELQKQLKEVLKWTEEESDALYINHLEQEINELTHYLHQRLMIQLTDLMKDSINPVTIDANGKQGRQQIKIALKRLQSYLAEQWSKEFNTTLIILERKMSLTLDEWVKQVNQYIENNTELTKLLFKEKSFSEPNLLQMTELLTEQNADDLSAIYKNKKEFFEQQEVQELFEQLNTKLDNAVKSNVETLNSELKSHFESQFKKSKDQVIQNYKEQQQELISQKQAIYQNADYLQTFRQLYQEIQ
ncbi:dynamin family protein [Piscibacillus salipiscarius]|uniref:Dynamin family protein n=1 Tax=Piscibacillus salipiscarius TaxID=299480 RepID=A0ABW5Q672_9BACI